MDRADEPHVPEIYAALGGLYAYQTDFLEAIEIWTHVDLPNTRTAPDIQLRIMQAYGSINERGPRRRPDACHQLPARHRLVLRPQIDQTRRAAFELPRTRWSPRRSSTKDAQNLRRRGTSPAPAAVRRRRHGLPGVSGAPEHGGSYEYRCTPTACTTAISSIGRRKTTPRSRTRISTIAPARRRGGGSSPRAASRPSSTTSSAARHAQGRQGRDPGSRRPRCHRWCRRSSAPTTISSRSFRQRPRRSSAMRRRR